MIRVDDLRKRYGDFQLDVSLKIPKGTITGLIGKNGAGKSTTIKAVLGLVKPDAGKVTVFGKNAEELTAEDREMMGVALSDASFSSWLSLEDDIRILKKMYQGFDEEVFRKRCKDMGLPLDKLVKDFSTGMKARARVLMALNHKAKVLILDEPTAGLDVEARMDILDMLREYMEEDEERAILITSHISTDLEGLCDDIYMIHGGCVVFHEDVDTILDRYAVLKVSEAQMEGLDLAYVLKKRKESYGYSCLTDQKMFYRENYPSVVVENARVDDLILMITGGESA